MPVGKSKYWNERVRMCGVKFDSKSEANRYLELLDWQRQNLIWDLKIQPKFNIFVMGFADRTNSEKRDFTEMTEADFMYRIYDDFDVEKIGTYTADFQYMHRTLGVVVEDVKSKATAKDREFRIRKKQMKAIYGIDVQEVIYK